MLIKKIFYIIFILILINVSYSYSQNCDWSDINNANQKYNEGNFDDAIDITEKCLTQQTTLKQRIEALRLKSKIHLALDQDSAAVASAQKIINLNSKFEPNYLSDPPRFIDIINNLKKISQEFVVVSISKKEENINNAPATAIVLNNEQIRNRGYLDFEALLHDLPGFDISRSNGNLYTHAYQRGYRSINTNRTLFLLDGVEDNDLWSSNVYLSRQFIMSNLKSIEFVYGPASTMYGSNAFLGVINIISKDAQDIIKTDNCFGTDIRAGYGSYNTKFVDGTIAAQTKDHNVSFMLSSRIFFSDEQDLSNYQAHDYEPLSLTEERKNQYYQNLNIYDSTTVAQFLDVYPASSDLYSLNNNNEIILTEQGVQTAHNYDNNVYENVNFSDRTETFAINAKLKIYDFTLGWYYWQKAEGPGSQYNDMVYMGFDQGQSWRPIHHFAYLKYEKDINDKLSFSNFLRFKTHYVDKNNRIVTYSDNYYSGSFDLFDLMSKKIPSWDSIYLFYKSNQMRNETKLIYQPISYINIIGGVETRFSSNQGDYFLAFDNNAEQEGFSTSEIPGGNQFFSRDIGVYSQASLNLFSDLNLIIGGRYDHNRVRLNEGYGNVFNQRFAVVYSPEKFIFKGIYATAFKDATNREKYSTTPTKRELPNPDLQPEKVRNYEFSIARQFNKRNIVNAAFYFSQYSNIIQEVRVLKDDGTYTNQNQALGKAQIWGINAYANWRFDNLSVYSNYTFTQPYAIDPTDNEGNPQTDSSGNPIKKLRISDIATNRANLGANYLFFESLNLNLRLNFVGKRLTGENTTVPTNTSVFNSYFLLNSTISYSIKNTGLTIQLTGFNLLNNEYFEPGLDEATGELASKLVQNKRNVFLSVYYKF